MRKIIHVDMDAFYASVEIRDNPSLKGKPVIISGSPDSRSVVCTCSYEARKFGVHSAMPASKAQRLCPQGIFIYPRMDVYKAVSRQIQEIFHSVTPLFEPMSLDEAYLDVSDVYSSTGATGLASYIKSEIYKKTGLTASAGVSYNKFIAKIASDWKKPDGLTVIRPEDANQFIEELSIKKFYGIGKKTAEKMESMGIHYGKDLLKLPLYELIEHFGKSGKYYFDIVRGIDNRQVETQRQRKSLGKEITFDSDISELSVLLAKMKPMVKQLLEQLQREKIISQCFTLKIRYTDFRTRSKVLSSFHYNDSLENLMVKIAETLEEFLEHGMALRLIGCTFSKLTFNEESSMVEGQYLLF